MDKSIAVVGKRSFQLPPSLRSLSHRDFALYWSGQVISFIGTWMQMVAQSWLVYRLTDSPLMLGLVNVVALAPAVPISLLAGVISDRVPRRKLIVLTELGLGGMALILAALTQLNIVRIWHVILLSFGVGALSALEQPARMAFVMDIVGKEDVPNAVALTSSARNATRVIGPAIAGILVAWLGEGANFALNGVSYLFVVAALLAIRTTNQVFATEDANIRTSLVKGFKYIWNTKTIHALMEIVAVSSFFNFSYITLMPVFADEVLKAGPKGVGFLMASVGIGALIGSFATTAVKHHQQDKWLAWGNILSPVFLILFTLSRSFLLSLFLVFFVAGGNALRQTLANSLLQVRSDNLYHGRVMSVFNLMFTGMSQAGAVEAGALAEFTGAPLSVGFGALVSLVWGIFIFRKMPHAVVDSHL